PGPGSNPGTLNLGFHSSRPFLWYNHPKMLSRTRNLILLFSLAGLAFSAAASYVHYKLLTVPNYVSPCDINARFNCSDVYLSQYGSFHGVSVALAGLVFFGMVSLVAAFGAAQPKRADDATTSYVF